MTLSPHQFPGALPVHEVQVGARAYSRQVGLYVPHSEDYGHISVHEPASRRIADAYDAMPEFDKHALPAYHAMRDETRRQFDHMTKPRSRGGMGINVEVTQQDPYGSKGANSIIGELRDDVMNNNRIKVMSTATTGEHAVFSNDDNDKFRAVHDVFGHLGSGRGIDMHGEEAAFQKHSRMFSPLARQAMATETRGQNAALHKHGEFQEQKIGLLPTRMQMPSYANVGRTKADFEDAHQENIKQGLL